MDICILWGRVNCASCLIEIAAVSVSVAVAIAKFAALVALGLQLN